MFFIERQEKGVRRYMRPGCGPGAVQAVIGLALGVFDFRLQFLKHARIAKRMKTGFRCTRGGGIGCRVNHGLHLRWQDIELIVTSVYDIIVVQTVRNYTLVMVCFGRRFQDNSISC